MVESSLKLTKEFISMQSEEMFLNSKKKVCSFSRLIDACRMETMWKNMPQYSYFILILGGEIIEPQ